MSNERFNNLPTAVPQLTDIICAVQGYESSSVLGTSVQETLADVLTLVPALGLNFTTVTTEITTMIVNYIYFVNYSSGLATLTLPATSSVGQVLYIMGGSVDGWIVTQNAGQQIIIGSRQTTIGGSGEISSTNQFDSLQLICTVANTTWQTPCGPQGDITIV
jgi:hypothetical protein